MSFFRTMVTDARMHRGRRRPLCEAHNKEIKIRTGVGTFQVFRDRLAAERYFNDLRALVSLNCKKTDAKN